MNPRQKKQYFFTFQYCGKKTSLSFLHHRLEWNVPALGGFTAEFYSWPVWLNKQLEFTGVETFFPVNTNLVRLLNFWVLFRYGLLLQLCPIKFNALCWWQKHFSLLKVFQQVSQLVCTSNIEFFWFKQTIFIIFDKPLHKSNEVSLLACPLFVRFLCIFFPNSFFLTLLSTTYKLTVSLTFCVCWLILQYVILAIRIKILNLD